MDYIVHKGDSIDSIARGLVGDPGRFPELVRANEGRVRIVNTPQGRVVHPDDLQPGARLRVPAHWAGAVGYPTASSTPVHVKPCHPDDGVPVSANVHCCPGYTERYDGTCKPGWVRLPNPLVLEDGTLGAVGYTGGGGGGSHHHGGGGGSHHGGSHGGYAGMGGSFWGPEYIVDETLTTDCNIIGCPPHQMCNGNGQCLAGSPGGHDVPNGAPCFYNSNCRSGDCHNGECRHPGGAVSGAVGDAGDGSDGSQYTDQSGDTSGDQGGGGGPNGDQGTPVDTGGQGGGAGSPGDSGDGSDSGSYATGCSAGDPTLTASGYCAGNCTDLGCKFGQPCDANHTACLSCGAFGCPGGQTCNTSTGMCAGTGTEPTHTSCAAGYTWNGSACVANSQPTHTCPSGQSYDSAQGACVQNNPGTSPSTPSSLGWLWWVLGGVGAAAVGIAVAAKPKRGRPRK